ncbi:sigma-54 dependent transcriptional regulator [Crenobacter cavernae]|uniref:Sigma-54-dependent Fis family transcriptional regulator n=1 Tax=Crenobacter cavernae TaxID=2290923 RepID=A0ABY0FF41_9NEIS|nr:sigma-54 dependent transcriptional regulator [Crenobacter cavernae]RXZ44925.1 sigma-54-dependent Fis family transcriptional regulator [Crenobacter cavernae]
MISPRQLVVVGGNSQELAPVLSCIKQEGWSIVNVAEVRQLSTSRMVRQATVGLIFAEDGRFERSLRSLSSVVAQLDMEWIVVLNRILLTKSNVQHFVSELCYDYHCRPIEMQRLSVMLGHAHGKVMMRRGLAAAEVIHHDRIIGDHPLMQQLKSDILKLARTEVNVLITGESGTGKELVAQTLHSHSPRADKPFQAINCGGLPGSLVQTELFGHEKGAFTGAQDRRLGRIEVADGGAVFLDEIGDMAIEAQANLLRFLQEGTIDRVGSSKSVDIDVRVISATHVNLPQAVASGHFREDLFYRLNVCHLHTPSLRERLTDILPISRHLIECHADKLGVPKKRFSAEAVQALTNHHWPGNVRELSNRVCQGLVMASGRYIKPADMNLIHASSGPESRLLSIDEAKDKAEKEALEMAIGLYNGNNSQAARILGVSRATFYRLLRKHQLADV